jgi:serine/threonine-protein kinase
MARHLPWHRTLAWKFFFRTALAILLTLGAVLAVASQQSAKRARESATAGISVASQIMDKTFQTQAKVLDAGLEVFTLYSANLGIVQKGLDQGDHASVRDLLLENLRGLSSDVAIVVRPSGALLSCTTDGYKQDYTDVGVVQMAMHPEEAAAAGNPGPAYVGYFEIPGGTYKGLYHGVARRLQTAGSEFIGVMLVAKKLDDAAAADLRRNAMVRVDPSDPAAHMNLVGASMLSGSTLPAGTDRNRLETWIRTSPDFKKAQANLLEVDAKGRGRKRSEPFPLSLEGHEHLGVLARLDGANAQDLGMANLITMPLEPFQRPFATLQKAILIAGSLGMLVALALALGTARAVTAPLARLTEATGALAEGERPDLPAAGTDEVGQLTSAFRQLLSELRAKEELIGALEKVRESESREAMSKVGMSMVDVDATVMIPSASQVAAGGVPMAQRRTLTLKEGDKFGDRYRIDKILGKGGMGVVLKARDQQLDEDVALKVIRPEFGLEPAFLDQLKQEIRLARKISHKNVLRTHDFGEADGIPFVSMEYLRGVTLKQLLDDRGSLPLPLVLRIGRQVAEGLEAAHAGGVVHRDIKPLNVMFDLGGDAKLMDFGLAAPVAGRGTDAAGQIFGTPRYMAPEQVRGERVDPRTDLYALGVMLFELATGTPPFDHASVTEVMRMQLQSPIPDPRATNPSLPREFSLLVSRLMAKAMEDRPSGAAEVVELMKLVASGGTVTQAV